MGGYRPRIVPITEIIRVLAWGAGPAGRVDLLYDTDGSQGFDEGALGFPQFWLRGGGCDAGPFEDEEAALTWAERAGVVLRPVPSGRAGPLDTP